MRFYVSMPFYSFVGVFCFVFQRLFSVLRSGASRQKLLMTKIYAPSERTHSGGLCVLFVRVFHCLIQLACYKVANERYIRSLLGVFKLSIVIKSKLQEIEKRKYARNNNNNNKKHHDQLPHKNSIFISYTV